MNHKVGKRSRHSIRLKGYDYANSGTYFLTIVTKGRSCLFGEIINAETRLNDAGSMIERWWFELNNKFPTIETDDFVIMPNHFHGIVAIADVGADLRVGPNSEGAHIGAPLQRAPLPAIVQWFKTMTTNEYLRGIKTSGWAPFRGQLWQRNYYEHVIRDEETLNRIREYILNNPVQWAFDPENPTATATEPPDLWRLQKRREGKGDGPVATNDVKNT